MRPPRQLLPQVIFLLIFSCLFLNAPAASAAARPAALSAPEEAWVWLRWALDFWVLGTGGGGNPNGTVIAAEGGGTKGRAAPAQPDFAAFDAGGGGDPNGGAPPPPPPGLLSAPATVPDEG